MQLRRRQAEVELARLQKLSGEGSVATNAPDAASPPRGAFRTPWDPSVPPFGWHFVEAVSPVNVPYMRQGQSPPATPTTTAPAAIAAATGIVQPTIVCEGVAPDSARPAVIHKRTASKHNRTASVVTPPQSPRPSTPPPDASKEEELLEQYRKQLFELFSDIFNTALLTNAHVSCLFDLLDAIPVDYDLALQCVASANRKAMERSMSTSAQQSVTGVPAPPYQIDADWFVAKLESAASLATSEPAAASSEPPAAGTPTSGPSSPAAALDATPAGVWVPLIRLLQVSSLLPDGSIKEECSEYLAAVTKSACAKDFSASQRVHCASTVAGFVELCMTLCGFKRQ